MSSMRGINVTQNRVMKWKFFNIKKIFYLKAASTFRVYGLPYPPYTVTKAFIHISILTEWNVSNTIFKLDKGKGHGQGNDEGGDDEGFVISMMRVMMVMKRMMRVMMVMKKMMRWLG